MKNIKVLVLAKDIDGGTGTYVKDIVALNKYFNITLLIINPPKYRRISFKNKYIFPKKNPENYYFSFSNVVFFLKEILFVRKIVNKIKPDIILSVDVHSNIIAQIFKYIYNTKTILTTHIYLKKTIQKKSTHIFNFFLRKTVTFLYNRADILIGVSKEVSASLKHDFKINKHITTIYHGIKANKYQKIQHNKSNRIITICRIDKQKDLPTLIEAFKTVKNAIPNASLIIVGDGPERGNVIKLIKKLGLSSSVRVLSWKNDIEHYLEIADLFVLSSHYEGFSYAILEAMSHGLPVISTNSPFGPREIIQKNKFGILIPILKPQKMANAIIKVLQSKKKFKHYSQKSIDRSQDFPMEKMLNTYKNLIYDTCP